MELKHDWKVLNEVLFPQEGGSLSNSSVVMIEDHGRVVAGVVSSGAPFRDVGLEGVTANQERIDEIVSKYGVERAVVISKKDLDLCLLDAAQLGTNYFQQLRLIQERILFGKGQKRVSGGPLVVSGRHFVLDLFRGFLQKLLPSRFNVLVFVDQRTSPVQFASGGYPTGTFGYRAILLSYFKGQLDQFYEPDFSSLHENRLFEWQKERQAIGQYLESRYILPCYGIFMYSDVWQRCLETAGARRRPWAVFVRAMDDGKAAVYPQKFLAKALLALQRIIMYFSRA